jgi:hypothetical protein
MMSDWNPTERERISSAREIEVSSLREDGALTKPVTIWAVRVEDEIYIRSVRGDAGGWFKAAEQRHEGRIEANSTAVDVAFEPVPHHLDAEIDDAYKAKYGYPSDPVDSITADAAQATTIRVVPR